MPTFKIDGREIPFEQGDTIIRAAHRAGIDIPHYCWHPGLSRRGQLPHVPGRGAAAAGPPGDDARHPALGRGEGRLRRRRRSRSSSPPASRLRAEGMEVLERVEPARRRGARAPCRSSCSSTTRSTARSAIRPASAACRTTGSSTSARGKRMRDEPVHKPKAVVFGPTIVYDAERCIVCTRCVRVSRRGREGSGARACASAAT